MAIYRNHDGKPVANIPGTLWYNVVGKEDLNKAAWYLNKLIDEVSE